MALAPHCHAIEIVGSLRRNKPKVHDIDIVCAPVLASKNVKDGLFEKSIAWWTGLDVLSRMQGGVVLCQSPQDTLAAVTDERLKCAGLIPWPAGDKSKPTPNLVRGPDQWDCTLMFFCMDDLSQKPKPPAWAGLPVDIYIVSQERFELTKLIRTGSKDHNMSLAKIAKSQGMKLHADGRGIETADGQMKQIGTEEQVFGLLKLPYKHPHERE